MRNPRRSNGFQRSYFRLAKPSPAVCLYPALSASSAPVTNILPHSMRPAVRKPAIAQMITFWKNVACICEAKEQLECHSRQGLPETPLPGLHDPEAQEQISDRVGEQA